MQLHMGYLVGACARGQHAIKLKDFKKSRGTRAYLNAMINKLNV